MQYINIGILEIDLFVKSICVDSELYNILVHSKTEVSACVTCASPNFLFLQMQPLSFQQLMWYMPSMYKTYKRNQEYFLVVLLLGFSVQ